MPAANKVTNPAVSNSGEVTSLLTEKFTGRVKAAYDKQENLLRFFNVERVEGTNVVSEKFIGDTDLQVLSPGADPEATPTQFEKNALTVDTTVLARNAVTHFHEIQSDIEGLNSKLSKNQSGKMARLEDEMVVQQIIYGGISNTKAARSKPRVSGLGFSYEIKISEAQASDPEALQAAIELAIENMVSGKDGGDGIEKDGLYIMMPWTDYGVLRDAEHIVNQDYRDYAGETVTGFGLKSWNVPVMPSNRFPKLLSDGATVQSQTKMLSNAANGNRYTASVKQAKTKAIIFNDEALLVGKTIDMTSEIWRDPGSKSWFVDTFQAEGAIPSAWEAVAVINTDGDTTNDAVQARADRKIRKTRTVT